MTEDHEDVVVVGLGYVGLPLAQRMCATGRAVRGLDASPRVVEGLTQGRSHVDDLADSDIEQMLERGFRASADPAVVRGARTVVICVPTPLSEEGGPDLSAVEGAGRSVAANLQPGTLVVLESTTYPGTTEEFLLPILEEGSGLTAGRDFSLAFSPERIDPGNQTYGVQNTPKVVGGLTAECTRRAQEFYGGFIDTVVPARGTREAEMSKLLENTYRHVNIAMVNEMAQFCHELDIDLWDVIALAKTKPFGFAAFYPGPGVGGHCIPIDPNYLSHRVQQRLGHPFRFVELAQEINAGMPNYVAHRIQNLLNEDGMAVRGSTVLLLGVTYKPDIADQRESPAQPLARRLLALGATLQYHDPHVDNWSVEAAERVDDPVTGAAEADVTVLLVNHAAYDVEKIGSSARRLLDTRGTAPSGQRL